MTIHGFDLKVLSFLHFGNRGCSGFAIRRSDIAARCPYLFSWLRLTSFEQVRADLFSLNTIWH